MIGITDSKYYDEIGSALQEKLGTDKKFTPAEMGGAILSIEGGGGGSATPEDVTVIPTKSQQIIRPSASKYLNAVTVEPIPAKYVDTRDASATSADILAGKTAYVNGVKVTGILQVSQAKPQINILNAITNADGTVTVNWDYIGNTYGCAMGGYWVNGGGYTGLSPSQCEQKTITIPATQFPDYGTYTIMIGIAFYGDSNRIDGYWCYANTNVTVSPNEEGDTVINFYYFNGSFMKTCISTSNTPTLTWGYNMDVGDNGVVYLDGEEIINVAVAPILGFSLLPNNKTYEIAGGETYQFTPNNTYNLYMVYRYNNVVTGSFTIVNTFGASNSIPAGYAWSWLANNNINFKTKTINGINYIQYTDSNGKDAFIKDSSGYFVTDNSITPSVNSVYVCRAELENEGVLNTIVHLVTLTQTLDWVVNDIAPTINVFSTLVELTNGVGHNYYQYSAPSRRVITGLSRTEGGTAWLHVNNGVTLTAGVEITLYVLYSTEEQVVTTLHLYAKHGDPNENPYTLTTYTTSAKNPAIRVDSADGLGAGVRFGEYGTNEYIWSSPWINYRTALSRTENGEIVVPYETWHSLIAGSTYTFYVREAND